MPYQIRNPDLHKIALLEGVKIGDVKRIDWLSSEDNSAWKDL